MIIRICQQCEHAGIVDHYRLNLLCALPWFPLCDVGLREMIITQVREEVSALIPVDVLGILPYYDGLLYASYPQITFLLVS